MKKYIDIILEENKTESILETMMNLNKGIEYVVTLDDGRLTRKEQEILYTLGQTKMINCYAEAIKVVAKNL